MLERKLNGRELMLAGRWDEALPMLGQEIKAGKVLFYNYLWRGLVYRHLSNVAAAIVDYSAALNSPIERGAPYGGYWDAHYYRGSAYLAQGAFALADADQRRYIDLIFEQNAKIFVKHEELRQRFNLSEIRFDPKDYPPLGLSFSDPQDCKLALADCEFALVHGHAVPTVYFCMGAAYEGLRDFFRAIDCYRKIGTAGSFAEAVKLAIERSQKAALYVEVTDKQLLQPGIEYLTIHGDWTGGITVCYYFDLDGEREEKVEGHPKPSDDWKMVASRAIRELYFFYYQRRK